MTHNILARRPLVIGMVHLLPLPGSPGYGGSMEPILEAARRDALALAQGGVHAIMVENFGDVPFARGRVGTETVAAMTVAARVVAETSGLPLGINVLRNDGLSAMAVAAATGAAFIRVNVLAGARLTDQGIVEGIAYELLRYRTALGASNVAVLADISVKHSRPLAAENTALDAEELVGRSGAAALIVTGATTGRPVDEAYLAELGRVVDVPILVGSGVTPATASRLLGTASGFIVGTSLKEEGRLDRPVDPTRVRALMQAVADGASS